MIITIIMQDYCKDISQRGEIIAYNSMPKLGGLHASPGKFRNLQPLRLLLVASAVILCTSEKSLHINFIMTTILTLIFRRGSNSGGVPGSPPLSILL